MSNLNLIYVVFWYNNTIIKLIHTSKNNETYSETRVSRQYKAASIYHRTGKINQIILFSNIPESIIEEYYYEKLLSPFLNDRLKV